MALQCCGLNLNNERRELIPHGTSDFPCAGYLSAHTANNAEDVPWHWHEELEAIYLPRGEVQLQLPGRTLQLCSGQTAIINSNTLHQLQVLADCELQSLVFHANLVIGCPGSVFEQKYLAPLLKLSSFDGYLGDNTMTQAIKRAFDAMAIEPSGFEFTVRENLSSLIYLLYARHKADFQDSQDLQNQDALRVKTMLDFIHTHYAQSLTLAEIASIANIGQRECLRCFGRTIQISPMQYLIRFRVEQAASLLLSTDETVAQIALNCGFESASHFTQIFKRYYKQTPREYRK